jgi:hypothetical protein
MYLILINYRLLLGKFQMNVFKLMLKQISHIHIAEDMSLLQKHALLLSKFKEI